MSSSTVVPPVPQTFESIANAAARHGVHPDTIRRAIDSGQVRAYRHGKRLIRLNSAEVDAALLTPLPISA